MNQTISAVKRHSFPLSLILPAYNEEEGITEVLNDTVKALDGAFSQWEIIVIDNCSKDKTAEIVSHYATKEQRVKLIRHDSNKFYSGSCKTGLNAATGDYVAIMDSDGQFLASDIPKMISALKQNNAQLILGWRRYRNDSIFRKAMSWFFNKMGWYWLGFPLHDLNSGIRVMDKTLAKSMVINHSINMVNPELFAFAVARGYKVIEIEIEHRERIGGKTSHDLSKLWTILITVNNYMKSLKTEHLGKIPAAHIKNET